MSLEAKASRADARQTSENAVELRIAAEAGIEGGARERGAHTHGAALAPLPRLRQRSRMTHEGDGGLVAEASQEPQLAFEG
jgi:hypothetical protein